MTSDKRPLIKYAAPLSGEYDDDGGAPINAAPINDAPINPAPSTRTLKHLLAPQTIPLFTLHYELKEIGARSPRKASNTKVR